MAIIDISRELFSSPVYPGDPAPSFEQIRRIDQGDSCNLTAFYSGSHSATHLDAPLHFVGGGETIDRFPLDRFYGPCTVVEADGILSEEDVLPLLPRCRDKILFKGNGRAFLSADAGRALAEAGVTLVGTDAQSVAAFPLFVRGLEAALTRAVLITEG